MKTILLPLLAIAIATNASLAGNWFGSGPWANGAYYAGSLDGKYQASVTGQNTAGVLGFAIRDGSVPFLQIETQSTGDALVTDSVVVNQTLEIDQTVNYYAIFVNGRTYTGTTAAGININDSSIAGTLLGTQPSTLTNSNSTISSTFVTNTTVTTLTNTDTTISSILLTNTTVIGGITNTTVTTEFITNSVEVPGIKITNTTVSSALATNTVLNPVLITTGVDGSFQASVTGKTGIFTFQGPGQLTYPGTFTNGQQLKNPATPFTVNGIRTSFSSQAVFQSVNNSTATPSQ